MQKHCLPAVRYFAFAPASHGTVRVSCFQHHCLAWSSRVQSRYTQHIVLNIRSGQAMPE